MTYQISKDCIGCGTCAKKCPENAIDGEIKKRFDIDPFLCIECGTCFSICPRSAVMDPDGNRPPKKRRKKISRANIDPELCAGCRTCFLNCPREAISVIKKGLFSGVYCHVDPDICIGCGTCTKFCITGAVKLT
ncbi:MAG TPA: 4Fe-4S binding protein [Anaerolineae bacterium]|nr:4Fe-4S binding protein [Anaerolineae bacterium]